MGFKSLVERISLKICYVNIPQAQVLNYVVIFKALFDVANVQKCFANSFGSLDIELKCRSNINIYIMLCIVLHVYVILCVSLGARGGAVG